jgi:hypothetical protein
MMKILFGGYTRYRSDGFVKRSLDTTKEAVVGLSRTISRNVFEK